MIFQLNGWMPCGSEAFGINPRPSWNCLVLMDVRLPDMDGVEARSRLRMDERTASIPVLAVTAQAMRGDRERFIEAGFDGYLSKPLDVDELVETVRRHCEGGGR